MRSGLIGPGRLAPAAQVAVFLAEPIDAAATVEDLLLARVERMAIRAHLDMELLTQRRAGREFVAAAADHLHIGVFGVDVRFHVETLCGVRPRSAGLGKRREILPAQGAAGKPHRGRGRSRPCRGLPDRVLRLYIKFVCLMRVIQKVCLLSTISVDNSVDDIRIPDEFPVSASLRQKWRFFHQRILYLVKTISYDFPAIVARSNKRPGIPLRPDFLLLCIRKAARTVKIAVF